MQWNMKWDIRNFWIGVQFKTKKSIPTVRHSLTPGASACRQDILINIIPCLSIHLWQTWYEVIDDGGNITRLKE